MIDNVEVDEVEEKISENIVVTNAYIFNLLGTDNELFKEIVQKAIPIKTSYWMARAVTKMTAMLPDFEKSRQNLTEKYAEKDAEGVIITTEDDKGNTTVNILDIPKFNEEINELLSIENDLGIKRIKYNINFDDEEESKKHTFSIQEMSLLMPLLQEMEE